MTDKDIKDEVLGFIEQSQERMSASWIVQSVLNLHAKPDGADCDFYLCCAYGHVRAVVRATLQGMRQDQKDTTQALLPGFERLQRRYIVEHDGELQAVPIEDMSREEITQKVAELEQMASGCLLHAQELRRYMSERWGGIVNDVNDSDFPGMTLHA